MVRPTELDHGALLDWLQGRVPAWASLDHASLRRLLLPPSDPDAAVRLSADLTAAELTGSWVAVNAPLLLQLGLAPDGLGLTARGNLQRSVVRRLCRSIAWPGFDADELLEYYASPNEEHAWPVQLLRILSMEAGLLRKRRCALYATRLAKSLLADAAVGRLQAALFEAAVWRVNQAYFDGLPLEQWPQAQFGLVLWCLSRAAMDWQTPELLARTCALPEAELLALPPELPRGAFELRVLRPLQSFGLLDQRIEQEAHTTGWGPERSRYRKSPLFDRFLSFELAPDGPVRGTR